MNMCYKKKECSITVYGEKQQLYQSFSSSVADTTMQGAMRRNPVYEPKFDSRTHKR